MKITLPDKSERQYDSGTTFYDIAADISEGLARQACCVSAAGVLKDLYEPLTEDVAVTFLTANDKTGLEVYRHSASHLLAAAVLRLYPEAIPTIGPAVEDGFYYDFDNLDLSESALKTVENEMKKIVGEKLPFKREELSREEALKRFGKNPYKTEIIEKLSEGETISVYTVGHFSDLCRGPHCPHSGTIKAFKLMRTAGAYWRGDSDNQMLTRIYGTAFGDKKSLKKHLHMLEEAAKRDHRKLGTQLDLFSIDENIGGGLVLWHPKGAALKNAVESFWRDDHIKNGYELVSTPHIGQSHLWQTSGHLDFYKEGMYAPLLVDEKEYYLKPMNCPFHINIYKTRKWSYRELPKRWAELGTVYRYEKSGVLHGLMRVRGFTQDDAHIICTPDQMHKEIKTVLEYCLRMLKIFGFKDFEIFVSTRPAEKSVGDEALWNEATAALKNAVNQSGLDYMIDDGGGAFYGPKIDIKIRDAIGRKWQCSTIQFDFNLPGRFDLSYTGKSGEPERPYMIHRALFGSIERFLGVLIEHYAGRFPVWIAPLQIRILTINDDIHDYAQKLRKLFLEAGLRVDIDTRSESLGRKVRDAQLEYIPCILTVGQKEKESGTVSVRTLAGTVRQSVSAEDFILTMRTMVREKTQDNLFDRESDSV